MKGLAPAVLVILIVVAAVVVEGVILTNFVFKLDTIQHSARTVDIVQSIDILESLRDAVKKSLDYSFFQSLYDTASKGGYQSLDGVKSLDCQSYWKVYSDPPYLPENFLNGINDNIQIQTRENFDVYKGQFQAITKNQKINIPSYSISLENSGSSAELSANSGEEKITAKKDLYTISTALSFKRDYEIDISKIYSASKSEFVDKNPISTAINNVDKNQMQTVSGGCKAYAKEYCEIAVGCSGNGVPTCEGLLDENCAGADNTFKDMIQGAVVEIGNELSRNYGQNSIGYSVNVLDSKTEHETKTDGPKEIGGVDIDAGCGCKEKQPKCPDDADWIDAASNICRKCPGDAQKVDLPNNICQKCSEYVPDDPETDGVDEEQCTNPTDVWQDAWKEECKPGTYCKKFSLSCEYNYKGAILAEISAKDTNDEYPVYDKSEKTVAMRNIGLKFLDLSSHPAGYTPIELQTNTCSS